MNPFSIIHDGEGIYLLVYYNPNISYIISNYREMKMT